MDLGYVLTLVIVFVISYKATEYWLENRRLRYELKSCKLKAYKWDLIVKEYEKEKEE